MTRKHKTFTFSDGRTVNRLGYGAMRLTGQPGNFGPFPNWAKGLELLNIAHESGVNFFDSAYAYGPEHADRIVGEALGETDAFLATKGGVNKPAPGNIVVDGRPAILPKQIDAARKNLNRDTIDLFQLHRVDPETPIEVSVRALAEAQAEGRIRHIGLSNIEIPTLKRALAVAPIASVQNRFNMSETDQAEMVAFTAERDIAFIPYGPLGANPMKQGAPLDPADALTWLLDYSPNIIVIPGTTSITHLQENIAAGQ